MADLQFVDQHNMVACMERSDENAEFYQIVDFLTTSSIHYALIVSPTIYASYIEQFWATAKSKTVNDVKQIHATVDGKTMVISESSVRSDLHFNDEDEPFNDVYVTPVHTKKVFTNMKRQNKDFSGRVTPLFASMLVPQVVEGEGEDDRVVRTATTASSLEAEQESDAQTRFKTASKKSHDPPLSEGNTSRSREDNMEHPADLTDFVPPTPYDSPLSGGHTPGSDEGRPNFNELINLCTQLSNKALALENSKTAQDLVIQKLKKRVKRLKKALRARTPRMKLFKI
ncbi:hypothetical protein Tco_1344532, partial [Tanacetum coccineum]